MKERYTCADILNNCRDLYIENSDLPLYTCVDFVVLVRILELQRRINFLRKRIEGDKERSITTTNMSQLFAR